MENPLFRIPPVPVAARRRARSRGWVHVLLVAATGLTATAAGAWFWQESFESPVELLRNPSLLLQGLPYAGWILTILGAHEMGHYLACRRHGIPATLPFFLPGLPPLGTFGAVIRIRGVIPRRKALFDVAAAGPIAGFAVALPLFLAGLATAEPVAAPPPGEIWIGPPLLTVVFAPALLPAGEFFRTGPLYGAGWVGMLLTSMNLFPVGQLDGGHAAYAISRRLHRTLAYATLVGLLGLVLYQITVIHSAPAYTAWLVVLLFMRDRHPRLADESEPLGPGRLLLAVLLLVIFVGTFIPLPVAVF